MPDESRESLEDVRLEKLRQIAELGLDPWGQRFDGHRAIGDVRAMAPPRPSEGDKEAAPGPMVRVAGRIMLRRGQGKVNFLQIARLVRTDPGHGRPEAGRRTGLEAGRVARPGRRHRRRRPPGIHPHRRADRLRRVAHLPDQEPAAAAREVARPDRSGTALPAAVCRPVQQPRLAGRVPGPVEADRLVPQDHGRAGVRRGRDAHDAGDRRRGRGPAVRHPSQCPRHRPVPADRARAVSEAAPGRRHGAGLRDRPGLSQRGAQPAA